MASTTTIAPNTHDNNDDGARDRAQDVYTSRALSVVVGVVVAVGGYGVEVVVVVVAFVCIKVVVDPF